MTTNLGKVARHFDQVAFTLEDVKTNLINHGTIDWRNAVFTQEDMPHYETLAMEQRGKPYDNWEKSYSAWTTHEMSDHLPVWVEIKVDYSDEYLSSNFINEA